MVSPPCNTLQYPECTVLARAHRKSRARISSIETFVVRAPESVSLFQLSHGLAHALKQREYGRDDPRRAAGYAPRRQAARLDSALLGVRGHNKHVGLGFRGDDGGAGDDDDDESVATTVEQLAGAMVLERVVVIFSTVAGVDDQRLVLGRRDHDDDAGMAGIDDHDDDSRMVVRFDDDDPGVVRAGVEQ